MFQTSSRVRPIENDGAGGCRSRRKRCLAIESLLIILAGLTCPAHAGPGPVTQKGLPVQINPVFPEVGAPKFSFPTGDTGIGGGGAGGGVGAGGGGGGGGVGGATLATNYSGYIGQSVGSGQCVALVQATSDIGLTATWVPGGQVQGNTDLAPGTVIATFGSDGTYTNTPGESHAAIYLGQDATGILVEDQWINHPTSTRVIPWTTSNTFESGSKFYVVNH